MKTNQNYGDGWMTKNARDLYKIATRIAGFDEKQLSDAIVRKKGNRSGMVNMATVEDSMEELVRQDG